MNPEAVSDLTALRAEVEALRDETFLPYVTDGPVRFDCYARVLDLIDKHTREWQ